MSNTVLVIGQSGSGKSTSLRNLDPKSTFIISVLDKPLPFRGYKSHYNENNKNFYCSDDYKSIINYINAISERRPDITTLVIDDAHFLMANEFMGRASEKGFTKFTEIAQHMWQVMSAITRTRRDLTCFVLSHNEIDANGNSRPKTVGKLLDAQITLEAMVSVCLQTAVVDGEYKFLTQNDGSNVCKSPIGLFDEIVIDNDLLVVKDAVEKYFNDEE
jgi:nicotinamide riboside kinase